MKKTKRTAKKTARASKNKEKSGNGWLSSRQLRELQRAVRASLLPVRLPGAELAFRLTSSGVARGDREYEIPQFVVAGNSLGLQLMSRVFAYMAVAAQEPDMDGFNSRALFVGDGSVSADLSDECVLRIAGYTPLDRSRCLQMWGFRKTQ